MLKLFKNKKPVIAIDGTSGSGKGTLAENLCKKIQFDHLDSGSLYRIVALKLIENGDLETPLKSLKIKLNDMEKLKKKYNEDLRSEKVSKLSSEIAKKKHVRDFLLEFQRNFANTPPNGLGSIIDGRDIASVIIPSAEVKIYVDAKLDVRAQRRLNQLGLGKDNYRQILKSLEERDRNDKNRKESPLVITKESFFIDTSKLDENEVVRKAFDYIKKKLIKFKRCTY